MRVYPNPAELEIRQGGAELTRTCRHAELLPVGRVMVLEDLRIRGDRVEVAARSLSPISDAAEDVELYRRVRLKFHFDDARLKSGGPEAVFEIMDQWLRPFTDEAEAFEFSRSLRQPTAP